MFYTFVKQGRSSATESDHTCIFPHFFPKNFGPGKRSCVYVVGGEKLLLYSFLVGQYVLEGLESMAIYYRSASLEINSTRYQMRKVNQAHFVFFLFLTC